MAKKIVILSQVIFPRQSPRSNRATELAKEFARQGYDVTLYAVLGQYDYQEFSNNTGIKVKSLGKVFFNELDSDGVKKRNFVYKLIKKLLHYLLDFPDIELMFKTKDVLKSEKNIDLLITIGIPYSIHWGAALSRTRKNESFPKLWVADCGDPYMGNKFKKHPFYFKYVEKWFMEKVDFISIPIQSARKAYFNEFQNKIVVIPQGFKFNKKLNRGSYKRNKIPTFLYAGTFIKGVRDPKKLLDYLIEKNYKFKFIVYTRNQNIFHDYEHIRNDSLTINDYIPREELLKHMAQMDFLVNFENDTNVQSPSKLIDYAISGRPILSLNSNSINTKIIDSFLSYDFTKSFVVKNVEDYRIENVVGSFEKLMN